MKAIMISIRPQHVANILNGLKTLEIRKRFPNGYVGWVYIYCTKGKPYIKECKGFRYVGDKEIANQGYYINGKVVARFWCNKVENLYEYQIDGYGSDYEIASDTLKQEELLKECCLTYEQLNDYLGDINNGKAIHISNLKPFDKPKELKEFKYVCPNVLCDQCKYGSKEIDLALPICKRQLTRAPQSWCYIEV